MKPIWRFLAMAIAIIAIALPNSLVAPSASADTNLRYPTVNADYDSYTGIYLRNGTSMDNVDRVYSRYLYYGNLVDLICGTDGSAVGPRQNVRWHKARAVNGPAAGQVGWIADRYVDTPNIANQRTPGEPECESSSQPSGGGVVYFQPRYSDSDPTAADGAKTMPLDSWAAGDCSIDSGDAWPSEYDGKKVTTFAAWSVGRLGPVYAMQANPERVHQIDSIVLFDPGSYANFKDGCDGDHRSSQLYADWLSRNPSARLLILAGHDTRDPNWYGVGRHQGIQQFLFEEIRSRGIAAQVTVCNYNNMDHPDVLSNFRGVMNGGPQSSCPGDPDAVWHP